MDGAEDGQAQVQLARFLGVGAAQKLGAVRNGLLRVEGTLRTQRTRPESARVAIATKTAR